MANNDFILKSVSFHWRNYVMIDTKYQSKFGNYWSNVIFKNEKIIFKKIEKSDVEKNIEDLRKELFEYVVGVNK